MKHTIVILMTIILFASPLYAKEYHVSKLGHDTDNGSLANPFKTISAAAQVAEPGDVIVVHKGIYRERINQPQNSEHPHGRCEFTMFNFMNKL